MTAGPNFCAFESRCVNKLSIADTIFAPAYGFGLTLKIGLVDLLDARSLLLGLAVADIVVMVAADVCPILEAWSDDADIKLGIDGKVDFNGSLEGEDVAVDDSPCVSKEAGLRCTGRMT